jgi:hypothetical protein
VPGLPAEIQVVRSASLRTAHLGQGRSSGSWTWQYAAYCSPLPGVKPSAFGEGRFHTPLRGSAGFKPASLLISSLYSNREMKTSAWRTIAVWMAAVNPANMPI